MHPRTYIQQLRRLSEHRSYRRLLVGGAISALGDRIGYIAFLGAVTSTNSDALAVGSITIAEMLPPLFAAPLVSLIVDRYDRRRLMVVADIARAALFFAAVLMPVTWVFYATAFLSSALTILFEPARQALEPHYVPEGEITQANGIRMSIMSMVMICGPATGGLLVAAFGFKIAFLVNAVSFLASAWMVSDLQRVAITKTRSETMWQEILGGVQAVRESANLKFLFLMYSVFHIAIGIQFPLIYVFTAENLHGGPQEIGWLLSAIGVGGIVGGAWLASIKKEKNPFVMHTIRGKQLIAGVVALDGVIVIAFAGMTQLLPVMALYTFFGMIGTILNASVMGSIADESAEHLRGRVFALYSALAGPLIVLSIVVGTPFAREYGAATIFYVSGGAEIVLGAAAILAALRAGSRSPLNVAAI